MKKEILAKDIFKRNHFRSYSEFYLSLAIGNVLKNRGYSLNMDGMQVDADSVLEDNIVYYKKLLNTGAITLTGYTPNEDNIEIANSDIDTSYFDLIPLLKDNGDTLDWSFDYAKANYGEYSRTFLEFLKLGYTLVHLVAYHIVSVLLDGNKKKLVLHFDSQKSKTPFIYVNIYSCIYTMDWLKGCVALDIDFQDTNIDLDYSIFCNNGRVAGRYKHYTIKEKLDLLKKYGMVEGAILQLWTRDGICENNEYGEITNVTVMRLDEIGDDFLGVTCIALNKSEEEVYKDYYSIDEDKRHLYVDLLGKKPNRTSTELNIYGLGVENHFYDEEQFITRIDEYATVRKLVTIGEKQGMVEMLETDAIYWLLCQYGIEFDKDLYKKMYFGNKEPLWDMYN